MKDRRNFLGFGLATGAAVTLTYCASEPAAKSGAAAALEDEGRDQLGKVVTAYGERSTFEKTARLVPDTKTPATSSSRTPLADTYGIITPNALHFERHHAGVPKIDPAEHKLLIHGMVDRPLVFTLDDLKRLPSVSRVHFVECAGNTGGEWGLKTAPDVTRSHGLASCSEWTGVSLKLLLEEAGVQKAAQWLLAEGADACKMARSVPISKAMDDAMIAYAQNGEAIRPEQGYPLRLLLPGYEGNINVKWLRRIKVSDQPFYTKDETSKYTELLADGKAMIFTLPMDAKSVITRPSGGQKLKGPGALEITGLAWSGRGKITKVEVSTDGGATWKPAQLQDPVLTKAFTRFRLPWTWDGTEVQLVSRCWDETGYQQPTREELVAVRGMNSNYHCNVRKTWKIAADGSVTNA
ncbi:MAG: sulfite dehydrogenase [Acidobacteria bacterium]|nr:sulfite dehydrogenase [Acidobacteriota bacterium]